MRVNATQSIPVQVEMTEQDAILAILKNRGWDNPKISIKNNVLIKTSNYQEKIISEEQNDVMLFSALTTALNIINEENNQTT